MLVDTMDAVTEAHHAFVRRPSGEVLLPKNLSEYILTSIYVVSFVPSTG